MNNDTPTLLQILREQKAAQMTGGIYHKIQIALIYNSNHDERPNGKERAAIGIAV